MPILGLFLSLKRISDQVSRNFLGIALFPPFQFFNFSFIKFNPALFLIQNLFNGVSALLRGGAGVCGAGGDCGVGYVGAGEGAMGCGGLRGVGRGGGHIPRRIVGSVSNRCK